MIEGGKPLEENLSSNMTVRQLKYTIFMELSSRKIMYACYTYLVIYVTTNFIGNST